MKNFNGSEQPTALSANPPLPETENTIAASSAAKKQDFSAPQESFSLNVGDTERIVSGALGVGLAALAIERFVNKAPILGVTSALIGAALIKRSVTGTCELYQALGIDTLHREKMESGSTLATTPSTTPTA